MSQDRGWASPPAGQPPHARRPGASQGPPAEPWATPWELAAAGPAGSDDPWSAPPATVSAGGFDWSTAQDARDVSVPPGSSTSPTRPANATTPAPAEANRSQVTLSTASQTTAPTPTVAGLGWLIFLTVAASLVILWLLATQWIPPWATAIDPCVATGGGWECVVNDEWRSSILVPLVSVLAAFSLARGASVSRSQGQGSGYLLVLLALVALALGWVVAGS